MAKKDEELDKYMTEIMLVPDGIESIKKVKIKFNADMEIEPENGSDESRTKSTKYGAESEHYPHGDFIEALRELTEHGLNAIETEVNKTNQKEFTVIGIKLNGNVNLNQARVQMVMVKKIHRSEELYKLPPTPEILLNDGGNYLTWKDLNKKVLKVINEAEQYLAGKHKDDEVPLAFQLSLPLSESEKKDIKKASKKKETIIPDEPFVTGPGATA